MEIKIQDPYNLNKSNKKIRKIENKIYDLAHQNPQKKLTEIWQKVFENGLSSKKLIVDKTFKKLLDSKKEITEDSLEKISTRFLDNHPVIKKHLGKTRYGNKDRQATYYEPIEGAFWEILHLTRGELLKYVSNYNQKKTKLRKFLNAYEENEITLKMLRNEPVEITAEIKIDNKETLLPQSNPTDSMPDFEKKTAIKVGLSNKHKIHYSYKDNATRIEHEPNIRLYTKEKKAQKEKGETDFAYQEIPTRKVNFIVCHQLINEIEEASKKYIHKLKNQKEKEAEKIKNIKKALRDYLVLSNLK